MSPQKPYTFAIRTSQRLTKNCKRVCLANAQEEMKIVANLKDKMIKNKECQRVTKTIRNLGKVLILKFIALNKISSKLKITRFKIPNYAQPNRQQQSHRTESQQISREKEYWPKEYREDVKEQFEQREKDPVKRQRFLMFFRFQIQIQIIVASQKTA